MIKNMFIAVSMLFALGVGAQPNGSAPDEHSGNSPADYPAPVTLETLTESDKKDPEKVGEALANTFLQMMETKKYSDEDIERSSRVLTMMTCMQFNRKQQIDARDPSSSKWKVKAEWLGADDSPLSEILVVDAINRDLAAGYALCSLWNSKHIPVNRFTGFIAEKLTN